MYLSYSLGQLVRYTLHKIERKGERKKSGRKTNFERKEGNKQTKNGHCDPTLKNGTLLAVVQCIRWQIYMKQVVKEPLVGRNYWVGKVREAVLFILPFQNCIFRGIGRVQYQSLHLER